MEKIGGRYSVLEEIGTGATARVLRIRDEVLFRNLAVKVSREKDLLVQEGRVLASFSASFFPQVYDYWENQELGYLFMEYVQGENLQKRAKRIGKFTMQEILHIALQIAEALQLLHGGPTAYVYGDMKPEHIIIQSDGMVKLIDFGAACNLEEEYQMRGGTKAYAPPEMWNRKPDIRNDIYSYGVLLKFLFFYGDRNREAPYAELLRIIERCIQKDIMNRYQSMEQLISQLRLCAEK